MKRLFALCLIFLGLVAIANSEKLRVLPLKNGKAQLSRNLEVQETLNTISSYYSSGLFNARSDLGFDYANRTGHNYSTWDPAMTIIISSNETLFSQGGCSSFNTYDCLDPLCGEFNDSGKPIQLPFLSVKNATQLNITLNESTSVLSIVNGSWTLSAPPLYMYDCKKSPSPDFYYDSWPGSSSTYGMIGFGTEGDAANNFKTTYPIFSTHLNATKQTGEIIFGFDEGRIQSYTPAFNTLKTDANWVMNLTSIKYGDNYTYAPTTSMTLVFDMNVQGVHVPKQVYSDVRAIWAAIDRMSNCDDNTYCEIKGNNLSVISNLTFTLNDGTVFSIDPYHYWYGWYSDYTVDNETYENDWKDTFYTASYNNSGSDYVVLGYRPMSQFYALFEKKDSTTGNTITLYNPVPQWDGANYTAPEKPANNGGSGDGGNTTTPGDTTGGSTDTSGSDDEWITYLTYAGVAAVVIIFIVVIACCCCKSEPKPTAKKTLTVELRGADKSTESSVASSVRL